METYQAPSGKAYRDWQAVFDDAQPLPWTAFNTGHISGALKNNAQPESFPAHRDPAERYEYAVMAFHFRHPTNGDILIDTGFDRTYHDRPPYGNLSVTMRAYSALMRVQYTQGLSGIDLTARLEQHQIAPAHVFLTHLHADHTGGLPALSSQVHVYYGKQERTFLSRLLCGNHLKEKYSIHLLDRGAGRALAPFTGALDVFGDGTFWAVSTPGHTRDHLAYLINTAPTPVLIVGDAELTTWAMQDEILVSAVDGARGKREVQRSATKIREFHATYPNVQIWFSHDEEHL
jgi:glyoxylase-like metal-dependent hydrolase (beta-lactamase superfamily II)